MSYEEKIIAMRSAIGAVIVAATPDMGLQQKIDALELLFDELRGYKSMLEYENKALSEQAGNSGGTE